MEGAVVVVAAGLVMVGLMDLVVVVVAVRGGGYLRQHLEGDLAAKVGREGGGG